MSSAETVSAKHVFLDIVGYSYNRSVEAQTDIIGILNTIVKESIEFSKVGNENLILIPTGDGLCISLLDISKPFDLHIKLSLKILKLLEEYNGSQKCEMRKFQIRIGVNENIDNLITDINGRKNVAGAGITYAQRIMSNADAGNILMGQTVYDALSQRERYFNRFRKFSVIVKHNVTINIYQLVDSSIEYLNSNTPSAFAVQQKESKFSKLVAYLIGHIIKNREFIRKQIGGGQQNYALFQLMIFLATDSVGYSEATEFGSYTSHLPDVENKTLGGYFDCFMGIQFWVCCDYVSMFYAIEIKPYWGDRYFVPGTNWLLITQGGVEKLKREWPNIIKELDIA